MEAVVIPSTYQVALPPRVSKQFNIKPGKIMFIPDI